MDVLGFLNLVFIVVLVALWWGLYDAAHPPPEPEKDPFRSLAMSGIFVGGVPPPELSVPDTLDTVLARIGGAGGYSGVSEFLKGARQAYELIVPAVARGNIDGIAYLLTEQVAQDFRDFATARRERGETEDLTFIGFDGADVIAASFDDVATLDVRFSAEIVSVTRDREGRVIQGRADRVVRVAEIWTFERDLKSRNPRWLLAATDADE
jgi:hypothetical protein